VCDREGFSDWERLANAQRGGRIWWAHHAITCINIELTFPKEEIEENADILDTGTFSWCS
jgi:hypothetical protein